VADRSCIGCGYCCQKVPCPLGAMLYGGASPCAGLEWRDGRWWCGPALRDPDLHLSLCIGAGCCSPLNSIRSSKQATLRGGTPSLPRTSSAPPSE
jgi:hypothetical protein